MLRSMRTGSIPTAIAPSTSASTWSPTWMTAAGSTSASWSAHFEVPLLECLERRARIGKDVPAAGHHEQVRQAAIEGIGHRRQSELGDRGGVDLDRQLEARLLARLEA